MDKEFITKIVVYLEKIGFTNDKTPTVLGYLKNQNVDFMIEKGFFTFSSDSIDWSENGFELSTKKGKGHVSQETRYAMTVANKMSILLKREGFKPYEINDNLIIARLRLLDGENLKLSDYKPKLIDRNSINNMILSKNDFEMALDAFKQTKNLIMINYLLETR